MPAKVLLTTSGTGSRLGPLTRHTNKALVEIAGKPAITYIIDRYPADTGFVITVGYLADQVREEVGKLYPDRDISFVEVDRFEGPGSSLGYSMLRARSDLQEPFIFHCCDTLVVEEIPAPDENWAGGFWAEDALQYRTLQIKDGYLTGILDKGLPTGYAHVGLAGIYDYQGFWRNLEKSYRESPDDQSLNDTSAIAGMLKEGSPFRLLPLKTWYDTGNPTAFERTAAAFRH